MDKGNNNLVLPYYNIIFMINAREKQRVISFSIILQVL